MVIDMAQIAPGLWADPDDAPTPDEWNDDLPRDDEHAIYATTAERIRVYRDTDPYAGLRWCVHGEDSHGRCTEWYETFDTWDEAIAYVPVVVSSFITHGVWTGPTQHMIYSVPVYANVVAATEHEAAQRVSAAFPDGAVVLDGPAQVTVSHIGHTDVLIVAPAGT